MDRTTSLETSLNTGEASADKGAEQDALLQRISAALNPASGVFPQMMHTAAPVVSDVGKILIQLTEAVARAKAEAERERSLRLAIQEENHQLLMSASSQYGSPSYSSSLSPSICQYEHEMIGPDGRNETMSLTEVLSYISSLPPHIQDAVYISYLGVGLETMDYSNIYQIIKPIDFPSLLFIIFVDYSKVDDIGLVSFTYDNLQLILSGDGISNSRVIGSSAASTVATRRATTTITTCSEDEPPRMNLLEALNVQSDDDVDRILTVRKCHKLGFKSHVFLKQYFSKFGKVDRVVLLPMRAKPNGDDSRGNRPSSMGFVVMESPSLVSKILESNVHVIKGWPIEVRNFVKPADRPCDLIYRSVTESIWQ
jgi:hypothetical protein